ncbi:MAG TPA: HAD family hydrolase [Patescibacteria group bacterium]|nr:HAD family hydrolase [Patescibacteria group bacterium]
MERKKVTETLKTRSLDPMDLPFSESDLKKRFDLVVCDIDYTLVDFEPANQAGIRKLKEFFGEKMGEQIDIIFQLVLEGNRKREDEPWEHREEYESLMEKVAGLQPVTSKTFGVKVWSREAYIIIAAQATGVNLDKKKVEEGRDMYWEELKNNYRLFDGAKKFLDLLKTLNIPLLLMTGSDAVLNVNDDLTLNYDPEFSKQYKMRRLSADFPNIPTIIGDPIDKQYPEYFDNLFGVEVKKLGNFSPERTLVIGDSEKADLMFPRERGYPTLLVARG